jgi:OmpA-OmpF porin, OOP family
MKKLFFILIICLLYVISPVQAQDGNARNGVSASIIRLDYYSPYVDDFSLKNENITSGAMISYHRNLVKNFLNLEVPLKLAKVQVFDDEQPNGSNKSLVGMDALLQLQYNTGSNFLVPYLSTGFGAVHLDGYAGADFEVPAGVGLDFRLGEGIYLRARSEYRFSLAENRDNWNHIFGLKAVIGGKTKMEEPIEIVPTDRDGDGVLDDNDACPDVAGLAKYNGCPDTDGDGVIDAEDECPTIAGLSKYAGCPDTDNDGIIDGKDDCPNEAGLASNNGCPFKDRDGDGVIDNEDKCPDTAGPASNQGCPELEEEEKEVLTFAAQAIQFETGSAVIKTASFGILNQVADILNKYPAYKCDIGGHTDSVGNETNNQVLSEKRAKACYDYLINKGVQASRLTYTGYGESQPIADNKFAEGQKKNRRVVFEISL